MDQQIASPVMVEKERVPALHFPTDDVLLDGVAKATRERRLMRATKLGNLERRKIKIVFEDADGLKAVETTIWATTKKNIVLKRGVTIPINRVHRVEFF